MNLTEHGWIVIDPSLFVVCSRAPASSLDKHLALLVCVKQAEWPDTTAAAAVASREREGKKETEYPELHAKRNF